jgi:hypothetical protein
MTGIDPDEKVRRLAAESLANDDPTGWFERLYTAVTLYGRVLCRCTGTAAPAHLGRPHPEGCGRHSFAEMTALPALLDRFHRTKPTEGAPS